MFRQNPRDLCNLHLGLLQLHHQPLRMVTLNLHGHQVLQPTQQQVNARLFALGQCRHVHHRLHLQLQLINLQGPLLQQLLQLLYLALRCQKLWILAQLVRLIQLNRGLRVKRWQLLLESFEDVAL